MTQDNSVSAPTADVTTSSPSKADGTKSFTLKRSKIVVTYSEDYPSSAHFAAQKGASKDGALYAVYLAQSICTFNGEKWTAGQIREKLGGRDILQLQAEMLNDDEDGEGK